MKILPVELVREADAYTIMHEPIADIDLMERAAMSCVDWLLANIHYDQQLIVFCGSGNNGGDGYAIARLMFKSGYNTRVFALGTPDKMSASCRINYERLKDECAGCSIVFAKNTQSDILLQLPEIDKTTVVIDAIFGSGLTRFPEGQAAIIIDHINRGNGLVVAIDIPSGIFCDQTVRSVSDPTVIHADYTLTFSPPKLAFFFPENDPFVGDWQLLDIKLSPEFLDNALVSNYMITVEEIAEMLKKRNKYAHKGNFGHALLICGSSGKMGAAILSAKACLRSGAGLVTVRVPDCGVDILQTAVPEAMLSIDSAEKIFSSVPDLNKFNTIAVGPGIGTEPQTANALKLLIQQATTPLVFDADAINILAENKTWLSFIPKGSIFTPHPKEFERLVGISSDDFDRNMRQRDFSFRYHCYTILKGAHTAITTPDGRCFFNTTGNPGMATGGSGDVLTGIIAGLLAQGYSPLESSLLGVFIHGLAGDYAAGKTGQESMIASDITENICHSFQELYGELRKRHPR